MKKFEDLEACALEVARMKELIKDLEWEIEELKNQNKSFKTDLQHERYKSHRAKFENRDI